MEFSKLLQKLLEGQTLHLSFENVEDFEDFRNSFAVYHHRQISRLRDCGMADEFKSHALRVRFENNVAEITYKKKVRKNYNFTIIEPDEPDTGS